MQLLDPKPTDLVQEKPKIGDLILCGTCGTLSIIELTGTREPTHIEMNAMDADERKELAFAVRAIKRKLRQN